MSESLEDLIKRYISFGKQTAKGFFQVKCAKCNDYKERGGFKFENESVIYNCFNCSTSASYDPSKGLYKVSKNLKEVLLAFGIPEAEFNLATGQDFFKLHAEKIVKLSKTSLPIKEVLLPKGCVPLRKMSGAWGEVAREYLLARCLDSLAYDYYVLNDDAYNEAYQGRLFIPYFFRGKIVYWQARAMDDSIEPRYKNPVVEKDNIFFNMDELYRYTDEPLLITEGPLDALSIRINTIALTGSVLNEFKWSELRKVAKRRNIIFVIDKNLPGYKLGRRVLEQDNMSIVCFPDNIDDANDALKKLGKLWLTSYLSTHAVSGFEGKLALEVSYRIKDGT